MKNGASVYKDTSTKGGDKAKHHNCWRADVMYNGVRYRKRGHDYWALWRWARDIQKAFTP